MCAQAKLYYHISQPPSLFILTLLPNPQPCFLFLLIAQQPYFEDLEELFFSIQSRIDD
jgi:hypothetical protein